MTKPEPIWAVTFFDHWEFGGVPPPKDIRGAIITLWGRILAENETHLQMEIVHVDLPRAEGMSMVERRPANSVWMVVKGAIVSRRRVGVWKHP